MYLPFTNSCYSVPDKLIGYVYLPPVGNSLIVCHHRLIFPDPRRSWYSLPTDLPSCLEIAPGRLVPDCPHDHPLS
jgi:hypothetical protein